MMLRKAVFAIANSASAGKTSTVRNMVIRFRKIFPAARISDKSYANEVFMIIKIGSIKIGIISQGDPGTNLELKIVELIGGKCSIIICTTRTRGETVSKVEKLSRRFKYKLLWLSNYTSTESKNKKEHNFLNKKSAEHIVSLVRSMMEF